MAGIVDTVYPDGSPVPKASVRSFSKTNNILVLGDAVEVLNTDLEQQLVIMLKATGRLYRMNSGDTTTPPDGVNFLRDVNGLGFEVVLVQGFDGGAIFVEPTEPPVGDNAGGSLWIDSSSLLLDLYVLSGSPLEWTDTGLHLKGDAGADGSSAMTLVRVVAMSNVSIASALDSGDTIDGVTLATNDYVLLTGQTAPAENGIYVVPASGAASRATAFNTYNAHPGCYFSVMEGSVGKGKLFHCLSVRGGTLGSTALTFSQFQTGTSLNVTDFGAVPGAADNTAALQAAIDASPSYGSIECPAGVFNYTTLNFDNKVGIKLNGAGAINLTILRCIDTTGSGGCKFRSTFDVTCSYIHFDHSSAAFGGYLVSANHAPESLIDTQGLYFFRCTFGSQGWNKYSANGVNLNEATLVTFEGCKFGSLVRPVDGQSSAGGSYSNGIRFKNCQSFDNVGYFANYLGEQWTFQDCNFQACHDGAQRIAFSNSSTPFTALNFDNCGIYDAVAAGTSYLNLGPGRGLTIRAGMWGGRRDLGSSTFLSATGAIAGLSMKGVTLSLFTNVLVAGVSGSKGWDYNGGNVFQSCTTVMTGAGNVTGLSTSDLNATI